MAMALERELRQRNGWVRRSLHDRWKKHGPALLTRGGGGGSSPPFRPRINGLRALAASVFSGLHPLVMQ